MDEKEFIKRTGAIEILSKLSDKERSFGELKELGISSGTLSKRLKEAIKLGLVKQEVKHEEGSLKPRIVYQLTEEGRNLLKSIEHVKEEYLKTKEEIEKLKREIRERERALRNLLKKIVKGGD